MPPPDASNLQIVLFLARGLLPTAVSTEGIQGHLLSMCMLW